MDAAGLCNNPRQLKGFSGGHLFKAKSFQLVLGISLLFVANRSLRSQDASTKGNAPKTPPVRTSASPSAEVALTFDDLPSHGPLPQGLNRADIAKSIIGARKSLAPDAGSSH